MASNPGVYSLLGQGVTPLLNPLDIAAKRNALALQQQGIAANALSLQEQQRQVAANQAFHNLYASSGGTPLGSTPEPPAAAPAAPAPPPSVVFDPTTGAQLPGAPAYSPAPGGSAAAAPGATVATPAAAPAAPAPVQAPPLPTIAQLVKLGFTVSEAAAMIQQFQKIDENAANIRKTNADAATAEQKQVANLAQAAVTAKGNSTIVAGLLQHFSSMGPKYQQIAGQVAQKLSTMTPGDQLAYFQSLASQSPELTTANAETARSAAQQQEADTNTAKNNQAISDKRRADFLAQLGAVPKGDAASWNALVTDPANADLVKSLKLPPTYSSAAQVYAQSAGQSTNEQVSAAQTAKHNAALEQNEQTARRIDQGRLNNEVARTNIERTTADPWGMLGINPHPIGGGAAGAGAGGGLHGDDFLRTIPAPMAATVKAVSEGRQTNLPRGGQQLDQLMAAVNQYDPTYSSQRAQLRAAYTTGKQGQNIENLNTAVQHLDQYHEVMKAMNNGTFQPGNQLYNWAAEKLGASNVTNPDFVRQSLAGEAANALKGAATDPEIAGIMNTLGKNQSPAQQEGAALEALRILGTKLNTYDEHYHQLSGNPDDKWSPILPSAQRVFDRYGINPIARTGGGNAAPAAAAAPAGAVTVTDPRGVAHTFRSQADADKFKSLAGIK